MRSIFLGDDKETEQQVYLPKAAYRTHVHMPGLTGTGKTTLILSMLQQFLRDPYDKSCHVLVDFLGGLSWELMLWMSSRWCPQHVRDRLVYIEPARKDVVLGMNPLVFDDEDCSFYKVNRATDIILRAWDSQDIQSMARLARWLFNSFYAVSLMGLTIRDTEHLLLPGSDYHQPLLDALPQRLQAEWQEIMNPRARGEALRILESSRNRLSPFYNSSVLRRTFSSTHNRLDVRRFRRERKIVILNLAPMGKLSPQDQDALGGIMLNEFLADARSQPKGIAEPTYLWLDEFQRVVGPDLEFAIPEVRQLGIYLAALSHQSFAQLKRGGDFDLTPFIWVPRTRCVFQLAAEDADLEAQEFASLTYDPKRIKDEIHAWRQLQVGHRKVELASWGQTCTNGEQWGEAYGRGWAAQENRVKHAGHPDVEGAGNTRSDQQSRSKGGSQLHGTSQNTHEQLIAELETIRERCSTTYYTFEEWSRTWGRKVREQGTGEMILLAANKPVPREVLVRESRPGILGFPPEVITAKFPQAIEALEALKEKNFASDFFVSPQQIERETQERLERVLRPVIRVQGRVAAAQEPANPLE